MGKRNASTLPPGSGKYTGQLGRFMRSLRIAGVALCLWSSVTLAGTIPPEIYTDPAPDARFPATTSVLHVPSHGVVINGLAYIPAGPGPHPVLVICHGLPGNEKNLDLAQAVRRAGWVAITFNYRGSWGSPGSFSFAGNLEDAEAVMAYLREPKTAAALHLDAHRIGIAGHSMGGAITATVAARDHALIGAVLISAWDMATAATRPHEKIVAFMADDMETLTGVTAESMARDLEAHGREFSFMTAATGLTDTPLLVLTSDDGNAEGANALVNAIRAKGGHRVDAEHAATNHVWSDRRIELESDVITWLKKLH
jgi:acetyl esterase/lipase